MPQPVHNPPNPWSSAHVEWLEPPPDATLEVFIDNAKSALVENKSPDVPFRFGLNPYRGCMHACAYCYARRSHQHLGFGAGTDFDRKIVVKPNIAALLARELDRPSWQRDVVCLSGNTDCYQPLEASYQLTRGCLEVLAARDHPLAIITKGALVARDVDILGPLARRAPLTVTISVPLLDETLAKLLEPWASRPVRRLEAMRVLADAGVDVAVSLSPLIPGLNDDAIPATLEAAYNAGARRAFLTLLRLPGEVEDVFSERLRTVLPGRAAGILRALDEARGSKTRRSQFGLRMTGEGPRFAMARQLFARTSARLGYLTTSIDELAAMRPAFRSDSPPSSTKRQLALFEAPAVSEQR